LPDGTVARLEQLSKRIFRALHLTGYARMDFRLRPDGELFVLEANANPNISAAEDFSASALKAGMKYDDLLHRILQLGENYPAAWRGLEA
jgi:D-alanine-D-alanine ligase